MLHALSEDFCSEYKVLSNYLKLPTRGWFATNQFSQILIAFLITVRSYQKSCAEVSFAMANFFSLSSTIALRSAHFIKAATLHLTYPSIETP